MKTLFVVLITIISLVSLEKYQDTITIKATFDGYEDGAYYFTDEDEESSYEFQKIDSVASKKYDLTDEKLKGKIFNVTYKIETELDENEDEYSVYAILDLKLFE